MIVAGIGCRRGVTRQDVLAAIETALETHGLAMTALSALATTAFKRDEEAIFAAGEELGLPVVVVEIPARQSAPDRSDCLDAAIADMSADQTPSPSRLRLDASPPQSGGEEGRQALRAPVPRPLQGGEVPSEARRRGGDPTTAELSSSTAQTNTLSHSDLSLALAGTPSVSEAAALSAAGQGAHLLGPRSVVGSVTCAIASSGDAA